MASEGEQNLFSEDVDELENPDQYTEETGILENQETEGIIEGDKRDNVREPRITHLPLARVKNIMKLDPDLTVVSLEAVFLTTKATELFIQSLIREAFVHTQQNDKRTLHRKDIDAAIQSVDSLCFLEETLVNNSE